MLSGYCKRKIIPREENDTQIGVVSVKRFVTTIFKTNNMSLSHVTVLAHSVINVVPATSFALLNKLNA